MAVNQTRNAFFKTIGEAMCIDESIIIVAVDLAGPPFDEIREKYADRYIGVGIAEQNAIAIACGLASTGKRVVVYAANPFPFLRAFDQIRNCACTMELPIVIVGLGTGFSVAECGVTHLTIEDIALASLCVGLDIYSISDNNMAEFMALQITSFINPTYLRLGKWSGEPLGKFGKTEYEAGYRKIRDGDEVAVVATGDTSKLLLNMNLPRGYAIYDWFKLTDYKGLCDMLKHYERIVTVEEQQRRAGMGTILLEAFSDLGYKNNIQRIGIDLPDGFPKEYGNRGYWLNKFNITREHIIAVHEWEHSV